MQEVEKAIAETIKQHSDPESNQIRYPLDTAAARWAEHSLATYTGDTLRKAMDISIAMVEFTADIYRRNE